MGSIWNIFKHGDHANKMLPDEGRYVVIMDQKGLHARCHVFVSDTPFDVGEIWAYLDDVAGIAYSEFYHSEAIR